MARDEWYVPDPARAGSIHKMGAGIAGVLVRALCAGELRAVVVMQLAVHTCWGNAGVARDATFGGTLQSRQAGSGAGLRAVGAESVVPTRLLAGRLDRPMPEGVQPSIRCPPAV